MAYGFRTREHFKAAIYFHCGGLDLYLASPAITTKPRKSLLSCSPFARLPSV
jgi:hypothetical protein